jgi:hypothetical protein
MDDRKKKDVEEMIDFDTFQYEQFWKPINKKMLSPNRLIRSGCLYLRNPPNDDTPLPSPFYWLVSIHSHDGRSFSLHQQTGCQGTE